MSFLDKMKETAGAAAQAAASVANAAVSKTKTMASVGRVKLAVSQEEDKLKKAYTELGRLFYRDYTASVEADMEEYLPWCSRAKEAKARIQQLTEEMEAIQAQSETGTKTGNAAETPDTAPEAPEAPESGETADTEDKHETQKTTADGPAEDFGKEPPVGTLYVDTTGQEEE